MLAPANASVMGFCFWFLPLLLLLPSHVLTLSPEGRALLHFRAGIEDDPHYALFNWNAFDKNPCSWFGIRCANGKVVSIKLSRLSLKGILAPELGQLSSLKELILRKNDFMGTIPSQYGEMEQLEVLDLAYNNLTGQLPQDLGNLSSLNRLYLENNSFEGVIPSKLGKLQNLYELVGFILGGMPNTHFAENNCCEPSSIFETRVCNMKCLQTADFSGNYFDGEFPTCLQYLPRSYFYGNCLSSKGLQHQRSFEDCVRTSSSAYMRHVLLQSAGSAGGALAPSNNATNGTSWKTDVSNAPSPIVGDHVPNSSPAPSPSPSPSPKSLPEPSASPALQQHSSSQRLTIILVTTASSVIVFLGIVGIFVFLCFRHKGAAVRPWKSSNSGELQKSFAKGVPAFSRTELEAACEDFSNIIGSSPSIVLFKGTLANGTEIAVISIRKSAKSWSNNSEVIFWRKVELLSQMRHQNLVNLLGYCAEEEPFARVLVFEYLPNGTVFEHLHNKEAEHLDWATRMRIIMGVAYALEYMHHGFEFPFTHTKLDAKAVYLTEEYDAKLADFGLWKISQKDLKSPSEQSNVLGHDDLELSDRLVPAIDTNISDFGVFLLEMVSGRPPHCKELGSLSEWAMDYLSSAGMISCIIDPNLEAYKLEELEVIGNVALQCLRTDLLRPLTMKQITDRLKKSLSSLNEPVVPKSSPLLWAELQILSQD